MQDKGDDHVFLIEQESRLLPITESCSKCLQSSNIASTIKQSSKKVGEGWMKGKYRLQNRQNIETMQTYKKLPVVYAAYAYNTTFSQQPHHQHHWMTVSHPRICSIIFRIHLEKRLHPFTEAVTHISPSPIDHRHRALQYLPGLQTLPAQFQHRKKRLQGQQTQAPYGGSHGKGRKRGEKGHTQQKAVVINQSKTLPSMAYKIILPISTVKHQLPKVAEKSPSSEVFPRFNLIEP